MSMILGQTMTPSQASFFLPKFFILDKTTCDRVGTPPWRERFRGNKSLADVVLLLVPVLLGSLVKKSLAPADVVLLARLAE